MTPEQEARQNIDRQLVQPGSLVQDRDDTNIRAGKVDAQEAAIEDSLKRAERLRQAILKHAFEGKLVPQDPADEPATALLEKIRRTHAPARDGRQKYITK